MDRPAGLPPRGDRTAVGAVDEQARLSVANGIGDPSDTPGHHGHSHRLGLDEHDSESLDLTTPVALPARHGENITGRVVRWQFLVGNLAGEGDPVGNSTLGGPTGQGLAVGAVTDDHQAGAGNTLAPTHQ